ncbi:MAG: stage III sporulation protein AC [Clostridiaceae bacterium]|jgi:stage III sporulation protein AC|nr:stage III sporulation protein AC [Clostridiaceae bacterium]
MNIDLIFRIAAIGILISILNAVLKQTGRDELAMLTTLSGLVLVLVMVAREIVNLFNLIKTLFNF